VPLAVKEGVPVPVKEGVCVSDDVDVKEDVYEGVIVCDDVTVAVADGSGAKI